MSERLFNPHERVGMKYGRLTILRYIKTDGKGNSVYDCVCDCGSEGRYTINNLRERGVNADCGCRRIAKRGLRRNDIDAPREDCKSYMPAKCNCNALTELLCAKTGECNFYKPRSGTSC